MSDDLRRDLGTARGSLINAAVSLVGLLLAFAATFVASHNIHSGQYDHLPLSGFGVAVGLILWARFL